MTRARATALVLVNWKGVFYERYLLDRHVTSLEGANGAGKTTVMIAAYVVLLPDMSRLRFTNLGESGATGGDRGIWGRLGEPGRPSYAALELELGANERVILGVQLERKAEPTVAPVAFRISGVGEHVRLQDLFLVKHELDEVVPELKELVANAEKLGATVEVFRSIREYFEELFERGISPLRLANEEERGKLNEMLRTSMTGGISRALTSELRTFLFREETGLSDALSRMRANLDTCRRSRTEVFEAQRLERELNGVFDAGQALLKLALLAAKKQVLELSDKAASTARARDGVADRVREVERALAAASERERELRATVERVKGERAEAAEALGRALLAQECSARLEGLERDRAVLDAALDKARAVRDASSSARERARRLRDSAQDGLARAAAGLAQLERGLEELARRAHEHRTVVARLGQARELLGVPVEGEHAQAHAERARARVRELDAEDARRSRELESAALRRAEFERAFAALRELAPDAALEGAFERAGVELGKSVELEVAARSFAELEREHAELSRHAVRRRALVEQAASLDIALPESGAVAALNAAWSDAESALSACESESRRLEEALREARDAERTVEARRRTVELRGVRFRDVGERLARLGARLGEELDVAGAQRARERLAKDQDGARHRAAALLHEREAALELAADLEAVRGGVSPELVRLCDELDAELCASRFDDLEPEEAAEIEARLGPLADALLVLEPATAADSLAGIPREIPEVTLVSPDALRAKLDGAELQRADSGDLVIREAGLARVMRAPETPKLGRRARAARAKGLRERSEGIAAELERLRESQADLEVLSRELERVVTDGAAVGPDPAPELARLDGELASTRVALQRARSELDASHDAERIIRQRVLALRGLVAQSAWLAERPGERSLGEIANALERARAARAELERGVSARRTLAETLEALRHPPLSEDSLERARAEKARLELERDRVFRAASALEYVAEHRTALAFGEAETALTSESAIAPSLQAEHETSRRALLEAEQALEAAERDRDAATRAFQHAEGEHLALLAVISREREELARLSGPGPAQETEAHRERMRELDERLVALGNEERALTRELALASERLARERTTFAALDRDAEANAAALHPAEARLLQLTARIEAEGALSPDAAEEPRSSAELWVETRGKRELLLERLERARGGQEPARAVREITSASDAPAHDALETELEVWNVVRDWLLRCLPSRITQTHDAIAAVSSLRQHLALLEERLARQETDLRGASEDVARGIDVQIRRAQGQVRRLNQHLTGVRFGSIRGIRIRIARIERMDQVLRALREGATQELLFQPDLPIEEALNEIFRRHGGGKNGAQRLLDYREYLDLGVEVAREEGGSFEPANPTRLSTGEAIGVGAALMMVVLTEWERDANLLRGKRPVGSLRFLFLDEANRLSQDNLGVLFDLCQSLDLQLLIAAPEVARAEGNTTYRLVRTRNERGTEEVIVSGRRGIAAPQSEALPVDGPELGGVIEPVSTRV